jgi:hypothetical protein
MSITDTTYINATKIHALLVATHHHLGRTAVFTLDAVLPARSQYLESPATGHLNTGFSWFPCVYKQMLGWFPNFQVATTCFSCLPSQPKFISKKFHILCMLQISTATM